MFGWLKKIISLTQKNSLITIKIKIDWIKENYLFERLSLIQRHESFELNKICLIKSDVEAHLKHFKPPQPL